MFNTTAESNPFQNVDVLPYSREAVVKDLGITALTHADKLPSKWALRSSSIDSINIDFISPDQMQSRFMDAHILTTVQSLRQISLRDPDIYSRLQNQRLRFIIIEDDRETGGAFLPPYTNNTDLTNQVLPIVLSKSHFAKRHITIHEVIHAATSYEQDGEGFAFSSDSFSEELLAIALTEDYCSEKERRQYAYSTAEGFLKQCSTFFKKYNQLIAGLNPLPITFDELASTVSSNMGKWNLSNKDYEQIESIYPHFYASSFIIQLREEFPELDYRETIKTYVKRRYSNRKTLLNRIIEGESVSYNEREDADLQAIQDTLGLSDTTEAQDFLVRCANRLFTQTESTSLVKRLTKRFR